MATINPNKNLLGLDYKGVNFNILEPTAKGLADGSLTSFSAPALGVTSLADRRFYNFTSLQSLDLTGVTNIPEYSAYGCTGLTSLTLDSNIASIGRYAFANLDNTNLEINIDFNLNSPFAIDQAAFYNSKVKSVKGTYTGNAYGPAIADGAFSAYPATKSILDEIDITLNGPISNSFRDNIYVSKFKLNPQSQITNLAYGGVQYIFEKLGAARPNPSTNVFVFDFRNSSFTNSAYGLFAGGAAQVDHTKYFNIYFPASLGTFNHSDFEYSEHFNIFYKSIPTIISSSTFSRATDYKNFFLYDSVQTARISTNWTGIVNSIYGWAEENTFSLGDTLPATDTGGHTLTWYSDVDMTTQVTTVTDPTQIYYCSVGA